MKALKAAPLKCMVCNNEGAKPKRLDSGRVAELCKTCRENRFFLAEAERRALKRELDALAAPADGSSS